MTDAALSLTVVARDECNWSATVVPVNLSKHQLSKHFPGPLPSDDKFSKMSLPSLPVGISFGSISSWLTPAYFVCFNVDKVIELIVDAAVAFVDGVTDAAGWCTCPWFIGTSSGGLGNTLGKVDFSKIVSIGAASP